MVNSADVAAIYTYMLGSNSTYIANYDVNNDKQINAGDVAAVYNIILTK